MGPEGSKVYSLVASVPFSPMDMDIGHLARGQWNIATDRFRVWFLPGDESAGERPVCYVMVRKFDPRDMIVVYMHLVVNLGAKPKEPDDDMFTLGILCNDDVRARAALNSMLDIPPAFHHRSSVKLLEKRWRGDPDAVLRYMANVHSALAAPGPGGGSYVLKMEPPPGVIGELKRGMGTWWEKPK